MRAGAFNRSVWIPWVICALGAIYYCYEYLLRIAPSVMTSELMSTFNLNGSEVASFAALYYLAYVPMQIIVGLLMDRYGPRRLLTVACMFCAVGSYLFAGEYGLAVAGIGRFMVGFGSAFAFVGALKLATIWLPPNRFGLISGIIMFLAMLGAKFGDNELTRIVDTFGWQSSVYTSAMVGVGLSAILWLVIRDSNPNHPNHHSHVMDFKSVLAGLVSAVKNPQVWLNAVVGLLMYLSLSVFAEFWGIAYLQQAQGLSKSYAADANSMVFLGWALGSPFWGWLSDFIGRRILPLTCAACGALIMVCILLYVPDLSSTMLYVVLFTFGFFSSVQILVFAICHELTQMKIAGTAIALTNMVVMISGYVFPPFIGKILDMQWAQQMVNGARVYPPHAYQIALSIIPIGLLIAIIISFFIRETYCSLRHSHIDAHR